MVMPVLDAGKIHNTGVEKVNFKRLYILVGCTPSTVYKGLSSFSQSLFQLRGCAFGISTSKLKNRLYPFTQMFSSLGLCNLVNITVRLKT